MRTRLGGCRATAEERWRCKDRRNSERDLRQKRSAINRRGRAWIHTESFANFVALCNEHACNRFERRVTSARDILPC